MPTIAVSRVSKSYTNQIRKWVGGEFLVLGTDGYGRSDTRDELREFFEIDKNNLVINALHLLGKSDEASAYKKNKINFDEMAPWEKISIIELKVPNLGDAEETEIIEISVSPGDDVNLNDPILVLESEKAAMEIPSDYQGKIKEILVKEGDQVQEGMVYGSIEIDDSSIKEDKPPSAEQ